MGLRLHSRISLINAAGVAVIALLFIYERPLVALLLSAVWVLFLGYLILIWAVRPLRQIAETASALGYGNLTERLPAVGDPDIAAIGGSLNTMAKSLGRKMEELREDIRRTEAIVSAMSAGVIVFDRAARVVLANRSIQAILEIHGDAEGKMPMELVRHPSLGAAIRGALENRDVPAVDLTTSAGRVLLAKAAPVGGSSGVVELVVVVFHDLTEIRKTEKMRKDFIANASHEFKTPLTSIRGYAETLLNSEPKDPALSRQFLEAIERNAALLQALVDNLLVLARLESEPPVEKQMVRVRDLIEQQTYSRQHLLDERRITVIVECPPIEILADEFRLGRALSNLIDNAIYYNRPGGEIRITGAAVSNGFRLEVADTGEGIPQSELGRIFERFYRVEKSRTRGTGGTGLGLAIAKHAVESQGGTISVSSKRGAGATFTITLPSPSGKG